MYGVPFGVGLPNVLQWCQENNANINNATQKQIEDRAKDVVSRIKMIKQEYDSNKWFLSDVEKEIAKITTDPQISALDKLAAVQASEILETLKNPAFDYNGQNYLTDRKFLNGESRKINGVEKVCTDKRLTDKIFTLTISPSGKSTNLINDNVGAIEIYFQKSDAGVLLSYAAKVTFASRDRDVLAKQVNTVFQILKGKYGQPVCRKQWGMPKWDGSQGVSIGAGVEEIEGTNLGDLYCLLEWYSVGSDALLFRKNIIMIGDFGGEFNFRFGNEPFAVVYYEPAIAQKLITSHYQTIKDFIASAANEEADKVNQMRANF
jgi:hypothetical protein